LARFHGFKRLIVWNLYPETGMAKNAPAGDGQRKGMVRERSQLKTKIEGEEHWTKRDRSTGQFMDQKADEGKFKGVRREKKD